MDSLITEIADYVHHFEIESELAFETARHCLRDSLACSFLALDHPACLKLLGPVVPGANMDFGCRVPGTNLNLDPVKAAFDIGVLIGWLNLNDTWIGAETVHPSNNLGAILAVADWNSNVKDSDVFVRDILIAMIKAYEVQGILAIENDFGAVGLDNVLLVRIASTAVASWMLGNTPDQTAHAISDAWIDGGALRTHRQESNAGSRKSWAAADATSRAVRLALMAATDNVGHESAVSESDRKFSDVFLDGKPITLPQSLGSHVMENVMLKVSSPGDDPARCESILPLLNDKFNNTLPKLFDNEQVFEIREYFAMPEKLDDLSARDFLDLFVVNEQGMLLA